MEGSRCAGEDVLVRVSTKLPARKLVASALAGICAFGLSLPTLAQSTPAATSNAPLKGEIGAFGVLSGEVEDKLGFETANTADEDIKISKVRPGSAAAKAGLQENDQVIDAQMQGDALKITIKRNGNTFYARLRALTEPPPVLVAQQAKSDTRVTKPFTLHAEQKESLDNQLIPESPRADAPKAVQISGDRFALSVDKNLRLLSKYNLELIVDRSSSMHKRDCPGGLSRWDWVGMQASDIARALSPYCPQGITIIPFATEYDVFEHASAANVQYIFKNIGTQGGTRLFEPLTERLDNFLAHHKASDKPLLIVVITDGVPFPRFEPQMVKDELVAFSQKMTSPNEAIVIFFQIGADDRFGQRFLSELDQNLVNDGARYHFVHTLLFNDSISLGIGPALIAAIKQYAPDIQPVVVPHSTPPGQRRTQVFPGHHPGA